MAEFIVDYVMRLEEEKDGFDSGLRKILELLRDPDEKNDKRYPPQCKKRKLIREEDKKLKLWEALLIGVIF